MKPLSKKTIVEILNQYGLGPLKRLGQNFLVDGKIASRMVSLINPGETVIEVGSGLGSLTIPLAEKAAKVIALEKDLKLARAFENEFLGEINNVELIKADVLKIKGFIPSGNYSVLANLPFYITSPTIKMFLENENPPVKMILMVQREVAKRICSSPPNMSLLALSVQLYAKPKIAFNVSRNSFWPSPEIDCSVLIIEKDLSFKVDSSKFFKIARAGFSRPRAQLLNNFSKELKLDKDKLSKIMISSGIDPKRRAESLKLEEWLRLSEKL